LKFLQYEHPTVLDAKPGSPGFVIGKNWKDQDMIAAIPVVGSKHQLAIIQHGKCIKTCRNYSSAKTFILSLTKGAASALLL
jgi:hypothetical protein